MPLLGQLTEVVGVLTQQLIEHERGVHADGPVDLPGPDVRADRLESLDPGGDMKVVGFDESAGDVETARRAGRCQGWSRPPS